MSLSPKEPPACLYVGRTVHERRAPFSHRFNYRIASLLIDLDRLDDASAMSGLFSVGGFNLYSFHERDHGPRDGTPLAKWARTCFADAGIEIGDARIRLLCAPRVLGYVFNPLSIYFAEAPDGAPLGVIYQVHNTFGDAHAYVVPCGPGPVQHQDAEKVFHVSPFFDVSGRYRFTLRTPGERFKLTILKQNDGEPDLLATMAMNRRALTTGALVRLFASQPFSTLKTVAGIHWQALKLWLKGARYHSRPRPPAEPTRGRLLDPPSAPPFGGPAE